LFDLPRIGRLVTWQAIRPHLADDELSKSASALGVDVSLAVKDASGPASTEATDTHALVPLGSSSSDHQIEKDAISPSQQVPNPKSTLAARMAQRPELLEGPPAIPPSFTTPPAIARLSIDADVDDVTAYLPAVIEKARLRAEKERFAEALNATSNHRRRNRWPLVTLGLIAALSAVFAAGLLSGFAYYSANQAPVATAIAPPAPLPDLVWLDLLGPGAISPRGQSANGVTSDQAFQLADTKLHGIGGPEDADEARYWLRIGIANALADDRLRWALTQLGTLYARPAASPSDFAMARTVWELAAAKKDPVALCFLARLEAGGHGAPPNKAVALKLFQQAKETGQCSDAEQAIERLSR
jgi:TPR repeat protein